MILFVYFILKPVFLLTPVRDGIPYEKHFAGLGNGVGVIDVKYPDVVQFYGIPFALPPVNDRRFRGRLEKWPLNNPMA